MELTVSADNPTRECPVVTTIVDEHSAMVDCPTPLITNALNVKFSNLVGSTPFPKLHLITLWGTGERQYGNYLYEVQLPGIFCILHHLLCGFFQTSLYIVTVPRSTTTAVQQRASIPSARTPRETWLRPSRSTARRDGPISSKEDNTGTQT